jgi:phosphoserine phosphatase
MYQHRVVAAAQRVKAHRVAGMLENKHMRKQAHRVTGTWKKHGHRGASIWGKKHTCTQSSKHTE